MEQDYDKIIADLENQVSRYDTSVKKKSMISTKLIKDNAIYIGVVVGVFLLLLLWRPFFVVDEKTVKGGIPTRHLSIQKLLKWTLVLGALFCAGVYLVRTNKIQLNVFGKK